MTTLSKSETTLLAAIREYGDARYREGVDDTLSRIVSAARPDGNSLKGKSDAGDYQRAARGAGREYVTQLLSQYQNGAAFGELSEKTEADGQISIWTLRKELQRGKRLGRYAIRRGKWVLRGVPE